jgi:DNA-binding transcriptional regulator YiaG
MSEVFEIPKRTIENWETGTRTPPTYVEKLIIRELERIAEKK